MGKNVSNITSFEKKTFFVQSGVLDRGFPFQRRMGLNFVNWHGGEGRREKYAKGSFTLKVTTTTDSSSTE